MSSSNINEEAEKQPLFSSPSASTQSSDHFQASSSDLGLLNSNSSSRVPRPRESSSTASHNQNRITDYAGVVSLYDRPSTSINLGISSQMDTISARGFRESRRFQVRIGN